MKKMMIAVSTAALLFAGCSKAGSSAAAVSSAQNNPGSAAPVQNNDQQQEVVVHENPWTQAEDVSQAVEAAGVEGGFETPDQTIEGFEEISEVSYLDDVVEVTYQRDDNDLVIRKGNGNDNVSGVYADYSQQKDVIMDNIIVHMSGVNDTIHIATWTDGDSSYSITYALTNPGHGLTEDEVREIVLSMK